MSNTNNIKDTLYYLFLPYSELQPAICLIKECKAQNKDNASLHFQKALNNANVAMPYKKEEIIGHVKAEDELTEGDKKEIEKQGIIPDVTFSKIDLIM